MKAHKLTPCLAVVALVSFNTYALGQDIQIKQIINGEGLAPYMKFSAITPDYKAVKLELAKGGSEGGMGSLLPMMMMMGGSGGPGGNQEGQAMMGLMMGSMFNSYWTKADTVKMGGQEFLVTYKLEIGMRKDMDPSKNEPPIAASLRLALVRTDMIASISPDPSASIQEITKFLDQAKIPHDTPGETFSVSSDTATTAAILFPVFAQAKQAARSTSSLSNAKQLATGVMIYCADYDDVVPYVQGTEAAKFVLQPYLKNPELWKSMNPNGGEFKMNMAVAGVNLSTLENPAEVVLLYEENAWPDGRRCVAFADAHAKLVNKEGWQKYSATLKAKFPKSGKPLPLNYGKG